MKGFTLLETIIALAIMTMAFAAILGTISGSINASARTHEMTVIEMLAKRQMVETEYKFEGKTFDEVKKEDGGTFPEPYSTYRWKSVIKEIEFPNLGNMTKNAAGAAAGGDNANSQIADMMSKLVYQFLSKAIRQVTVTITWMNGSKEQSFEISTYWVDLNHEFQLSQ
ncbi:MAG: prepilin-type N-terminal cleavage/methylation domain-containing protein [Oligoflexia bacterium]|nr:prepilin-type N-terminal cleavage/methylation domain-containing protein [Oligoflexia bacterium]